MRNLVVTAAVAAALLLSACGDGGVADEPSSQPDQGGDPLALAECLDDLDPDVDGYNPANLTQLQREYPNEVQNCLQGTARDQSAEEAAKNQFREEFREQWLAGDFGEWGLPCADLERTDGNMAHAMSELEQRRRKANPEEGLFSYDQQGVVGAVIRAECESWEPPPAAAGTFENPLPVGEKRNVGKYEVTVTEFIRKATEEQVRAWDENVGHFASDKLPSGEHVLVTIEGIYRGAGQQEPWEDINIIVVDKEEVRYNGIIDAWSSPLRIGEEFTATVYFNLGPSTTYDNAASAVYLSPGPGDSNFDARVHWSD